MPQRNQPCATQPHDPAVAPRRPRATSQLAGLHRLVRDGRWFWAGVVLCGIALAGCSNNTSGPTTGIGPAAKLIFAVQPSNAVAGAISTPALEVAVQDAQGSTVTTATTSITVAIGTNPANGTLAGTTTVAAANGVATFSTLSLNMAGTGYTLTASAAGLTGATSSAFNISAGAAARLVFTVQPSDAAAGAGITPAMQVAVQDAQGNPVTTATTSITVDRDQPCQWDSRGDHDGGCGERRGDVLDLESEHGRHRLHVHEHDVRCYLRHSAQRC